MPFCLANVRLFAVVFFLSLAISAAGQVSCRDSAARWLAEGQVFRAAHRQSEALAKARAAESLLASAKDPANDTLLAAVWLETSRIFGEIPEVDSAEAYQKRVLALRLRLFGTPSAEVAEIMHIIGGMRAGKSDAPGSIEIRERALEMLESLSDGAEAHWQLALRLCNALALLHGGQDDPARARFYFDHAYALLGAPPRDTFWMAIVLDNDARSWCAPMREWGEAARKTARAEELMAGKNNQDWLLNHYDVRGHLFAAQGRFDSALVFHRLKYEGLLRQPQPSLTVVAHAMASMAGDFLELREPDSCLFWLQKSWDIEADLFGPEHGFFLNGYRMAARCFLEKKQPSNAEQFLLKSLAVNNFKRGMVADLRNPGAGCWSLAALGDFYFQRDRLAECLRYYVLADSAIVRWREETAREAHSREAVANSIRPMYENGVEAAWRLHQQTGDPGFLRTAFHFAERCKGLELSEAVSLMDARLKAGVPTEWRRMEDSLARETSRAAQVLRQKNLPEETIRRLEDKHWRCKRQLEALRADLDRRYHVAAENRLRSELADPDTLPAYCQRANSAVLSFFAGQERLHVFVAAPDGLWWLALPVQASELAEQIARLREAISTPPEEMTDEQAEIFPKQYAEAARWLCREGFEPAEKFIPKSVSRVVIVPDKELSLLPFEVLLAKMPVEAARFQSHDYLLRRYAFGYAPSATLLGQMERREIRPEKLFLGIAPLFADSLPPLKNAGRGPALGALSMAELGRPLAFFHGDTLVGHAASKERFLAISGLYRVLHFLTHGHADALDPTASWLMLFSEDGSFLRPSEVAALRLNAALVFLNACETGAGPVSPMEGVQSMARAFALAGAKSIVATGWRVDEPVAVRISDEFYRAVLSGQPKDAALAEAKRQLLAEPALANPFFWGSHILLGDRGGLF